jgi:hypothetical protein
VTSSHRTAEVLYESEATLRLVDQEIHELCGTRDPSPGDASELPVTLERAREQLDGVIAYVRASGVAFDGIALDSLLAAHDNVRRAQALVDQVGTGFAHPVVGDA